MVRQGLPFEETDGPLEKELRQQTRCSEWFQKERKNEKEKRERIKICEKKTDSNLRVFRSVNERDHTMLLTQRSAEPALAAVFN